MANPLVSIIIPCYNQARYISKAIDSVRSQTYGNWECIVVDDGSPDDTESTVLDYLQKDGRIRYIKQEKGGVSSARNNGIIHSSGKFILPLDADDYIGDDYLMLAVNHFLHYPNCKLVYCLARYFGDRSDPFYLPEYSFDKLVLHNVIFCSAVYKREDYDQTCGYNDNMVYGWEDWDFWLSLIKPDDEVYRIGKELFFYRIKESSRNADALSYENTLYRQIMDNHPDIYEEIRDKAIYYKYELDNMSSQLDSVLNSRTYKLARLLTMPVRLVKDSLPKRNR